MTVDELYAREIVTTRVLGASLNRVWRAWSEADLLAAWWGPQGFTNSFHRFEFRPGGAWHLTMHGPDGTDYPNELVYLAIDARERIVLEHRPEPHFLLTAIFETIGEQTKVTFRQLFDTAEICAMVRPICVPGNEDNFDRMEKVLAGRW
jgi:uncharacterized protein YndB with AHSA1/START domain